MSNLYEALGVRQSALDEEIRKAYKRKVLETHPDRLGPSASERENEIARTRFQKVHEAFDVLGDPEKRKTYDAGLLNGDGGYQTERNALDEQLKRMKERTEWAQRQRKRDEERISAIRAKEKQLRDEEEKKTRETKMAQEFLTELFALNPEWAERRQRIFQQKAQRAKVNSR